MSREARTSGGADSAPLLDVEDLRVVFKGQRRGLADVQAVAGVSLRIHRGETFALVGESGSGKSTTARAVLQLVRATAARLVFDGIDLTSLSKRDLRQMRRRMQMVFQDPYSSLDPSSLVADSVAEPLQVHSGLSGAEREDRVAELFEMVGLSPAQMYRYPHEFSGGQRQRLAIARALALQPDLLVCDEAVSALDVSTQNQVIVLLRRLAAELGVACLFITHDLAVVRHIAHRVGVMYLGRLVEQGPVEEIFRRPAHPYTQALLSAVPLPDPLLQRSRERVVLQGDLPDPSNPPPGCRFHTRCPHVMEVCRSEEPPSVSLPGGVVVNCHLHSDEVLADARVVVDPQSCDGKAGPPEVPVNAPSSRKAH
jgi:oligopeptide/dipeptide ABC transporter ATP-binding protein